MVIKLEDAEIRDIQRILKSIFIKDIPDINYFVSLLNSWLCIIGISTESCLKIINNFVNANNNNYSNQTNLNNQDYKYKEQFFININTLEQRIIAFLSEFEGEQNAAKIIMTLKSLLPQRRFYDRKDLPLPLKYIMYGILSYDGPTVAICDFDKKQIVKGYITKKEDAKGREYTTIKISEILIEACPVKVIIYDDPSQIETKFEIEWNTFTEKSFIIGPSSITEMISILKLKALVLNANLLESALITIFRAFVESEKAEFRDIKEIINYNMDLRKWIDNNPL